MSCFLWGKLKGSFLKLQTGTNFSRKKAHSSLDSTIKSLSLPRFFRKALPLLDESVAGYREKRRGFLRSCIADMAQLVEQRIRNAWVPGSSPGIGSGIGKGKPQVLYG